MLRWLIDEAEQEVSDTCTCRGEMEVMESRLLMSVNTISRMVELDERVEIIEGSDLLSFEPDNGEAWWI